ncbi:UNVERIFIED_CONTAM: hypothetical protein H355_007701 [Colinus virginianus]|nr:hypothetical protein H355_007701 [Colinus virginianus]
MSLSSRRVTLPAVIPITLQKRVIKVYSEDDSSKALEIPSDITARDVCQLLILKNHYIDDHNWTLFEEITHAGLERAIEDHELVMEVQSNWGMEEENRFHFRKNYVKYEFFKNPVEPRHLQFFCEFSNSDIYMSLTGKKISGAPTSYGFCFKYGMQLYQNYVQPYQGRSGCSPLSLTPMRRGCLRLNPHGSPIAMSNMAIHRSQSWFHHKISRDEAQRLILQHGLVDGVFLVRDSQSNPKTFVLSLSHGLKIKHFQIVPLEDDGKLFYTLDDGHTRFTDLIQLVEFYQLNKGVLPCKLKHYCARIPL